MMDAAAAHNTAPASDSKAALFGSPVEAEVGEKDSGPEPSSQQQFAQPARTSPPAMSPLSPFLVQQMGLGGDREEGETPAAAREDTDDLRNKWGFTPGAEDTLDASHGE